MGLMCLCLAHFQRAMCGVGGSLVEGLKPLASICLPLSGQRSKAGPPFINGTCFKHKTDNAIGIRAEEQNGTITYQRDLFQTRICLPLLGQRSKAGPPFITRTRCKYKTNKVIDIRAEKQSRNTT